MRVVSRKIVKAGVIKSSEVQPFERGVLSIRKLVDDHSSVSFAIVKIDGEDDTTVDTGADTFDFVLEGSGTYTINGTVHEVTKGDLVYVPKGSSFSHSGQMTMLGIHNPPFNPEKLEVVS
ncbi:cupin domain-containing protein [Patescibacteria group bacterium]|nr:cupin domain-containing protein [Patescibacteria group bacterium]